jgi:hypothetical protein
MEKERGHPLGGQRNVPPERQVEETIDEAIDKLLESHEANSLELMFPTDPLCRTVGVAN